MKIRNAAIISTLCLACLSNAHAHNDASAASAISALPVASVIAGSSAAVSGIVALPVALSVSGAVLVVKTVESTARGTLIVLERLSDGARASVEVVGKGGAAASVGIGTMVTVSVISTGALLSIAGEAIAFVANDIGRALLHNEQVTN
ncbi:hypothetical protein [Janthinobacterium sp. 17J80-10]|uniref:hypothetical protein n=1 Tax=Janthinobacterium sp. 17J80-10 TaxID=2497863 RepID=UPI00100543B2|nr:hypothetical protein [Janthinobacterium sp. 17J80-10]QAU33087.1 hypothetical protein EKL02_02245 [Janthinobacterium sp. 17J80-10]